MLQILRNQAAILDGLVNGSVAARDAQLENSSVNTRHMVRTDSNGTGAKAPVISLRPKDVTPEADADAEGGEPAPRPASPTVDDRDDPRDRDLSQVSSVEPKELESMLGDIDGSKTLAEAILNEKRELGPSVARIFIAEFDNRDKIYEKGLEKLNRWIGGGQSGTPFQWRGDRAYLNLSGAGPVGVRKYEEQLMKRMGFSRRLGRLAVSDLSGEIVVYERP